MARYEVTIKKSAVKELEKIPKTHLNRIITRIQNLADNPRPVGVQKLANFDLYRIRQGPYRIVYCIKDETVEIQIIKIGHRKDIYNS